MLLFTVTIYPQQKEKIEETQWERVIDKYGQKAVDGFNTAIEKATPIAEEGFRVAVKLQIAKGVEKMLPFALVTPFLLYILIFNYRRIKDGEEFNKKHFICLVTFIVSVFFIPVTLISFIDGVKYLIAPEWFAIKDIIELFN